MAVAATTMAITAAMAVAMAAATTMAAAAMAATAAAATTMATRHSDTIENQSHLLFLLFKKGGFILDKKILKDEAVYQQ